MVIDMNLSRITTMAQVRRFVDGLEPVTLGMVAQAGLLARNATDGRYEAIMGLLDRLHYGRRAKPDKSLILRLLVKLTGYSAVHVRRLVARVFRAEREGGRGNPDRALKKRYSAPAPGVGFKRRFTAIDCELLASIDAAHEQLSGPATKHLLHRAFHVFEDERFELLAGISCSHLYNLRASTAYQRVRVKWDKTRPVVSTIGLRAAPRHDGRPGFIRIDSVHQGDLDGVKGVYYINAVDCVTQWEVVACTERISEAYLLPVIEAMLDAFPFKLLGFHSDNGSEYINHATAKLLEKLRIEQTKSRPRQSTDNGLAETKNAVVVRKTFGYSHIPQHFAVPINLMCTRYLNPYLNFHRPCFFAQETLDIKTGKIKKSYPHELVKTPFERLSAIENVETLYLKPSITLQALTALASGQSDTEAALALKRARDNLFRSFNPTLTLQAA
jgi:transposase InsO family protein